MIVLCIFISIHILYTLFTISLYIIYKYIYIYRIYTVYICTCLYICVYIYIQIYMYMYVYILSTCVCARGNDPHLHSPLFHLLVLDPGFTETPRETTAWRRKQSNGKARARSCFKRQGMCLASSFFGLSLFCFCLKDPRQSAEFSAITLQLGILNSWDSGTFLRTRFLCNVLQCIQTDEMKILEIPIPELISQPVSPADLPDKNIQNQVMFRKD